MNAVKFNPFLGIALHAVGATFAATCHAPQKKVGGWSWQSYFLPQAAFCWFLLPIFGAWLTILGALAMLVVAFLALTWGNYLGDTAAKH